MNRAENAAAISRATARQRAEAITRHGMAKRGAIASEWRIWAAMRQRCHNQWCKAYQNYGGRGITVCVRWATFEAFIADMGPRPSKDHSIDRIDNDGPYSPENFRWATRSEQKANQRPRKDAIWIEHEGERRTLDDWAGVKGLRYSTLRERVKRGWPIEQALNTPTRTYGK